MTTFFSVNICSLPLSFILITHVIVASLEVMARNERGGRGVPKSLSLKELLFLGVSKALSERRGKPAGCAKTGAKCDAKLCAKTFFGGAEFARNFARKMWAYDLQYPKISHKFPACLLPKLPHLFSILFSWFFTPAHPGLTCHGLFPFFMARNRTSQRIGAMSATKLQHNIQ